MSDEAKELRSFRINDLVLRNTEQTKTKIIEGHAAVFNQITDIGGWYDEVIESKAFDNCDFSDVVMCINHNLDMIPLARCKSNSDASTLKISIDNQGLAISASLDVENNSDARTVASAIERGDLNGMSFMFKVSSNEWERLDTDKPLRRITGISKVYELGAVSFPAYTGTDIQARNKSILEKARQKRNNIRNSLEEVEKLKLKIKILSKEY